MNQLLPLSSVPPSSQRSPRRSSNKRSSQTVGWLAEELVAQWLIQQGGTVLQRRWACRWGELDLVAHLGTNAEISSAQATVAFVEVKSRRTGNWDLDGLLSITPQKQQKLWKAAELFLSDQPQLAKLPCRFDVALVHVHSHNSQTALESGDRAALINQCNFPETIEVSKPVNLIGYTLSLQHYIEAAFDS